MTRQRKTRHNEVWKQIKDASPGFVISNKGRVGKPINFKKLEKKNNKRLEKGRKIIKPRLNNLGFATPPLCALFKFRDTEFVGALVKLKTGKWVVKNVARCVIFHFSRVPKGSFKIVHKDGDFKNCELFNLLAIEEENTFDWSDVAHLFKDEEEEFREEEEAKFDWSDVAHLFKDEEEYVEEQEAKFDWSDVADLYKDDDDEYSSDDDINGNVL